MKNILLLTRLFSNNYKRFIAVALAVFFLVASLVPTVQALSTDQKKLYNKNILYYDLGCSTQSSITSGTGGPKDATFPNLSPEAMASAIDKYIKKTNPNSKMKNLGKTIVASAKNSNISPFLIVAISQKESSLSDPGDYNVSRGNNSFGRKATSSQPNFGGGGPSAGVLWYKWSSVKASVDHSAHENENAGGGGDIASYLREQYKDKIDSSNIPDLITEYSGGDGGTQYITDVKSWIDEMVKATAQEGGAQTGSIEDTGTASGCCAVSGSSGLIGSKNPEKAYNFLVGKGLTSAQSAGVVGSMMAESGESLDTSATNPTSGAYGIAQWLGSRLTNLRNEASSKSVDIADLGFQLNFLWDEIKSGDDGGGTLGAIKNTNTPEEAAKKWEETFERSGGALIPERQAYARRVFNQYGNNAVVASSSADAGTCTDEVGDANMKQTITVSTPGKFITLPSKYSCSGGGIKIDSRIAASVAYIMTKYNSCVTAGLEDGHQSHGAGLAVDVIPKNGNSKNDWVSSVEAAARDIGWFGDSATDAKGSKKSCANYAAGDYGQCMHAVYPDKFPKWMRWMGYNGAYCHGDPWHYYGCSAHLHIGWDTPNGDGVSSSVIPEPRQSVYTFPAPIPDDLKGLVN